VNRLAGVWHLGSPHHDGGGLSAAIPLYVAYRLLAHRMETGFRTETSIQEFCELMDDEPKMHPRRKVIHALWNGIPPILGQVAIDLTL
jgi:hypothetical protein